MILFNKKTLASLGLVLFAIGVSAQEKPNIIVFLVDDMGRYFIAFYCR